VHKHKRKQNIQFPINQKSRRERQGRKESPVTVTNHKNCYRRCSTRREPSFSESLSERTPTAIEPALLRLPLNVAEAHDNDQHGEDDDDDEDDVDDECAGDDDDDAPTLEHGKEGRPRRNKPALSQDAAVSARLGAGRTNNTEIVQKSPSRHCHY
jgi:hypothetical protein